MQTTPTTEPKELIAADELARRAGVNRMTVFRAAWRGQIPSVKIGRARRFDPAVVLRLQPATPAGQESS